MTTSVLSAAIVAVMSYVLPTGTGATVLQTPSPRLLPAPDPASGSSDMEDADADQSSSGSGSHRSSETVPF